MISKLLCSNLSLESPSASPGDSPSEKKGSTQFIDGKPVVPPKPGKPTTPQPTAKPQVNQFLSSIKLLFLIFFSRSIHQH